MVFLIVLHNEPLAPLEEPVPHAASSTTNSDVNLV